MKENNSQAQPEEEVLTRPKTSFFDEVKIHKFKILGGFLGVLVFAGAVFWAYRLGQKQVQPGPQPTPTLTPIPTVVSSPTPEVSPRPTPTPSPKPITWKIYTNESYGFQIKYPAEMVLGPEPKAPDPELLSSRSIYRPEAANAIEKGTITVNVRSTPLNDLVASYESLANQSAATTTVAGVKAKKLEWVDTKRTDGIKLYNQYVLFGRNDLSYVVSLHVDNDNSSLKKQLFPIFDQILSTFKFLE